MDLTARVEAKARAAREAASSLAVASTRAKNDALHQMARGLEEKAAAILDANRLDLDRAKSAGLTGAFVDRLTLTDARIESTAEGLRQVAALPDPVGEIVEGWRRPSGLQISRVRAPLGVVGFIYESRPNVTADAAGLCIKSGNAVILRGGSEAIESNTTIAHLLAKAVEKAGLSPEVIQYVDSADRGAVMAMLTLDRYIDLIIPRGGEEFVRLVAERATVPVLKHDKGLCHVYVDEGADVDMALAVTLNAKTHRVSVCNAMETLLVHAAIAPVFLPLAATRLQEAGVELRGDERTREVFGEARPATEADWAEEYLAPILAVRVVDDLDAAVAHIRRFGTNHTDVIVTESLASAREFLRRVNSSTVGVNCSTAFSDGYRLGLGAEIGISTSKLHAFGPMGLEELTTRKFVLEGEGQLRE